MRREGSVPQIRFCVPLRGIPCACPLVHGSNRSGIEFLDKLAAQDPVKQVVIAIPESLFIQGHSEQVCFSQPLQNGLPTWPRTVYIHHGITQWTTQQVEDRSLDEKVLDLGRNARQHLG